MTAEQTCLVCKEIKPTTEYRPDSRRKSGYRPRCYDCDPNSRFTSASTCAGRRRQAQIERTIIPFTPEQLAQRWQYYGNACWMCQRVATQTDHVKPLSKDGSHMLSNLRPICAPCNLLKSGNWLGISGLPELIESVLTAQQIHA